MLYFIFINFFINSCDKIIFIGNSDTGFNSLSSLGIEAQIEPDDAYNRSKPYLNKTFELRQKYRPENFIFNRRKIDYIVLKGDWYFVIRDTYPAKNLSYYLDYAVKINKKTGELIIPH